MRMGELIEHFRDTKHFNTLVALNVARMRPVEWIAILTCDPLLLDTDTIGRAPQVRRSNLAIRGTHIWSTFRSRST